MQNSDAIYVGLLCAIVLRRYFFSRRNELKLRSASHDDTGNTSSQYQSAYRTGHSTETALLEVLDGVYTAADDKQISVLIGLDLSAAFDTVDHSLLPAFRVRSNRHVTRLAAVLPRRPSTVCEDGTTPI